MRRNKIYNITNVGSRNELDDAIKAKAEVIEFSGAIKEELLKEAKEIKSCDKWGSAGLGMFALSLFMGPVGWIGTFSAMCFAVYGAIGKIKGLDMRKYNLYFQPSSDPRYIIVTKKFDPKYDMISGLDNCGLYEKNCSACGKKIKSISKLAKKVELPTVCPECGRPLFYNIGLKK